MNKVLIVVDMQNDFIDGSLGTAEAQAIVPTVVDVINNFDGKILATRDTHLKNYLQTREGKHLPVEHCIEDTPGWQIKQEVMGALIAKDEKFTRPDAFACIFDKATFGSTGLVNYLTANTRYYTEPTEFVLVGLCTDICVVSNAMLIKAAFPEAEVTVYSDACAGVTPESHDAALKTMGMCQINVVKYNA